MPRLHLLRHHRRANSSHPPPPPHHPAPRDRSATVSSAAPSPRPSTAAPAPSAAAAAPHPPSKLPPRSPADLNVLPAVDVGSPGLGSPGTWLSPPGGANGPAASTSTLATTTAGAQSGFSRTSTPHTALTSELSPTPVPTIPRPVSRPPQTRSATSSPVLPSSHDASSTKQKSGKRNLLNPMSLLRRRSSQAALERQTDLPEDFDPGIIYGTRHPDWSTPRNARPVVPPSTTIAGVDGKLAMAEGGETTAHHRQGSEERTSGFKEVFDEGVITGSPESRRRTYGMPSPGKAAGASQIPPVPQPVVVVNHEKAAEKTAEKAAEKTEKAAKTVPVLISQAAPPVDMLQSDNEGELSPAGAGEQPGRRKGVTLVDHPLALPHHKLINSSRFSFEGSSSTPGSAVPSATASNRGSEEEEEEEREVDMEDDEGAFEFDIDGMDEGDDDDGFAAANEGIYELQKAVKAMDLSAAAQETRPNPNMGMSLGNIGLAISSTPGAEEQERIADMDAEAQGLGLSGIPTQPPTPPERKITLSARHRLANPRNLDLENDSDIEEIENEAPLIAYEDDADLYFDDGIISGDKPVDDENGFSVMHATDSPALPTGAPDQHPTESSDIDQEQGGVRISMLPQDGSMLSSPSAEAAQAFPPFLNPVGPSTLGFTQQQPGFYAPTGPLDPLALSNLTYTLQQYQQQQAAGENSSGYDSDQNDFPGGYYSEDDAYGAYEEDDDDLVAAANGEVLASDEDGWYGSEFGMFQNGQWVGRSDLSRNDSLRPPIRRPSLTPISERSESSYRNSLVFPSHWQPQTRADSLNTDDMTLSQLLQLRKHQWGGSHPPSVSSGGSSPVAAMTEGWRPPSMVATSPDGRESGIPLSPSPMGVMSPLSPPPQMWIDMRNTVPPSPPIGPPPVPEQAFPYSLSPSHTNGNGVMNIPPPPGLAKTPPGLAKTPPGLPHAGANAMLPTKGSFEDDACRL